MQRDRAVALLLAFVNTHSAARFELGVLIGDDGAQLDLAEVADAIAGETTPREQEDA